MDSCGSGANFNSQLKVCSFIILFINAEKLPESIDGWSANDTAWSVTVDMAALSAVEALELPWGVAKVSESTGAAVVAGAMTSSVCAIETNSLHWQIIWDACVF